MSGSARSDIESLRLAREESREVLNHQLSLLDDIDDKAIRTTRLSLLLIALIVSVGQLMPNNQLKELPNPVIASAGISISCLSIAAFLGIGIFTVSDPPFGIGKSHRREIRQASYSEREWLNLLLDEYDEWGEEINRLSSNNATWLGRAQGFLMVAIAYLFVSAIPLISTLDAQTVFLIATGLLTILLIGQLVYKRLSRGDRND